MKKEQYGWVVCAVTTVTLFITAGIANTGFTVYQPYLIRRGGLSNTQSSALITLRSLFTFISMVLMPILLKKLEIKRMMCMALFLDCLSFAAYGLAEGKFSVYCVAASMAGCAHGLGGQIVAAVLISRWFQSHRGLAVGICSAATGLSAFFATPVLSWVIKRYSLKTAFTAESLFSLFAVLLVACFVYNRPKDRGTVSVGEGQTFAEKIFAEKNPPRSCCLLILLFLFTFGMASSNLANHLSVLFQSSGFESSHISLLVSDFGLALVIGKLSYGFAADRIGCFRTAWIWLACALTGIAFCSMAGDGELWMAFAGVMLMGFGLAVSTVALPMYASGISTKEKYDVHVTQFHIFFNLGALLFGVVPGVIADHTGTYVPAYLIMLMLTAVSVTGIQLTYRFITKS